MNSPSPRRTSSQFVRWPTNFSIALSSSGAYRPPNKRFDTDPQQRRFAPPFRAGQSQRSASKREN